MTKEKRLIAVITHMKRRAFTLVELLVVIAIIGILAAAALLALGGTQAKARDATRKSDLTQIRTIFMAYSTENSAGFPIISNGTGQVASASSSRLGNVKISGASTVATQAVGASLLTTVLSAQLNGAAIPDDPQAAAESVYYMYTNRLWDTSLSTPAYAAVTTALTSTAPNLTIMARLEQPKMVSTGGAATWWMVSSNGTSVEAAGRNASTGE